MNCPLCDNKVTYVGLNTIECSGRNCANYKAAPATASEFDVNSFDDTPIDWTWFCGFVEWLDVQVMLGNCGDAARGLKLKLRLFAIEPQDRFEFWYGNDGRFLSWYPSQTRAAVRLDMSQPRWSGLTENPFYEFFSKLETA